MSVARRLSSGLFVLLMLTSCSADERDPVADRLDQQAALRERPSLEQEQARLTAVQNQVREALSTRLGLTTWSQVDGADSAGCADYPDSDGSTSFMPGWVLTDGVPDAVWDQAVAIVEEIAGPAGFRKAETVIDQPGQHNVILRGERESVLTLGSILDATLRLEAGCHLPEPRRPDGSGSPYRGAGELLGQDEQVLLPARPAIWGEPTVADGDRS